MSARCRLDQRLFLILKLQLSPCESELPARSFTSIVTVAMYEAPAARFLLGLRMACLEFGLYVTTAGTVVPPFFKKTVGPLMVAGSIFSEKVEITLAEAATFLALSVGLSLK